MTSDVRDDAVERVAIGHAGALPLSIAQDLAAAELALVAVHGEVALDLGDERRVAEANSVAGRRPEHVGVVAPVDDGAHGEPPACSVVAVATRRTVFSSPGSKRTAVPAGMSSRRPFARARSKTSAPFVSANG